MDRKRVTGYLVSLPERALRSLAALAGGAVIEVGEVTLPARLRRTRLYRSLVESTARFLVERLGEVEAAYAREEALAEDFFVRRAAGNVIEIAGLAAFRASPVWVFAALADLAGAGRDLIVEISRALQEEGLLEKGRTFENASQLLDGLERTSARLAETANTPPLDVASLRREWTSLRSDAARMPRAIFPSREQLWKQWRELQQEATAQQRSVVELSSLMALATVRRIPDSAKWLSRAARTGSRRTGEVIVQGLLDHYRKTLAEIHQTGYVRYWLREFQPYLQGAMRQFSPGRESSTERLLQRRQTEKS